MTLEELVKTAEREFKMAEKRKPLNIPKKDLDEWIARMESEIPDPPKKRKDEISKRDKKWLH